MVGGGRKNQPIEKTYFDLFSKETNDFPTLSNLID